MVCATFSSSAPTSTGRASWVSDMFPLSAESSSTSFDHHDPICVAPDVKRLESFSWLRRAPNDRSSMRSLIFSCAKRPIRIVSFRKTQISLSIRWQSAFVFIIQYARFARKVPITSTTRFELQQREFSFLSANIPASSRSSVLMRMRALESVFLPTWRSSWWTRTRRLDALPKSFASCWNITNSSWNISSKTSRTASKINCVRFSTRWKENKENDFVEFKNIVQASSIKLTCTTDFQSYV